MIISSNTYTTIYSSRVAVREKTYVLTTQSVAYHRPEASKSPGNLLEIQNLRTNFRCAPHSIDSESSFLTRSLGDLYVH